MLALDWLEQTDFAQYLGTDPYAFPILLALHAVGMGTVVGLVWVSTLVVLGFRCGLSYAAMPRLWALAAVGFALNALSGALLFIPEAARVVVNLQFQMKMACIAVAAVLAWLVARSLRAVAVRGHAVIPLGVKALAVTSSLLWVAAIFSGRYIAYTLKPPV